jgi:poly(3-hydroxybutyrate) depolymerase
MFTTMLFLGLLASIGSSDAAKSSGCGQPVPKGLSRGEAGKSNDLTFGTSDSSTRRYLLHIPETYDVNIPTGLIWSFAGRGKDAEHQEKITKLSDSALNPGYIVIYPQAETNNTLDTQKKGLETKTLQTRSTKEAEEYEYDEDDDWQWDEEDDEDDRTAGKNSKGQGQWQGDPASHVDDVKFTLELLEAIEKSFCIDDQRTYASGLSNGGGFVANVLACDPIASTKFAAFAAASGAYYQNGVKGHCDADNVRLTCANNGAKVPLIVTHGGSDKVIKYEGGKRRRSCLPSVHHFVTSWAERDGLGATNVTSQVPNTDAVHFSFGEGASTGMVQSYYVPGMGHTWPMEKGKATISATKIFLEFFAEWNMTARETAAATIKDHSSSSPSAAIRLDKSVVRVLSMFVTMASLVSVM